MGGRTRQQQNKKHKTKFSTKSQRTHHKIEKGGSTQSGGAAAAPSHQGAALRAQRVQRAKTLRDQKRADVLSQKREGKKGLLPPKIVVIVGLSRSVDLELVRSSLTSACSSSSSISAVSAEVVSGGMEVEVEVGAAASLTHGSQTAKEGPEGLSAIASVAAEETVAGGGLVVPIPSHKAQLTVFTAEHGDLPRCLELLKLADVLLIVLSPSPPNADTASKSTKLSKPAFPPSASTSSSISTFSSPLVDSWGTQVLSLARAQGLPTCIGLAIATAPSASGQTATVPATAKQLAELRKDAGEVLLQRVKEGCRLFLADKGQGEMQQLVRHLCDLRPSQPSWRSMRPYLLAHSVEYVPSQDDASDKEPSGKLLVSGFVRGRGLSVKQAVHVARAGDFHISQIDALDRPKIRQHSRSHHRKASEANAERKETGGEMDLEGRDADGSFRVIAVSKEEDRDPLVVENEASGIEGEQTWPSVMEMEEAEKEQQKGKGKEEAKRMKMPKGTSEYQAAWYEGVDEAEEDEAEEEGGGKTSAQQEGKEEGMGHEEEEEDEDDWESEDEEEGEGMDADASETPQQREEERKRLKEQLREDLEFPDEVEAPVDVPARQRFARYRGLKSFRTSPWDTKESLPASYSRIFTFDNYPRTKKLALQRAAQIDSGTEADGCVAAGSFVRLHLVGVPKSAADALIKEASSSSSSPLPPVVWGLLPHETRMSVVHFGIKRTDGSDEPIASKQPLLFHVGFRSFTARPLFSSDDLNADKHKLSRFLLPSQFCVASVFAQILFPSLPVLVFKEDLDSIPNPNPEGMGEEQERERRQLRLVATGVLRDANPDRIVLKKIVLTGHPTSVSKRNAVVKYMLHSPDDVRWFKPVELFTKYGRRGRIKEPLGLRGNMKCVFDGVVQQRDAVCMPLYKRVYPKRLDEGTKEERDH